MLLFKSFEHAAVSFLRHFFPLVTAAVLNSTTCHKGIKVLKLSERWKNAPILPNQQVQQVSQSQYHVYIIVIGLSFYYYFCALKLFITITFPSQLMNGVEQGLLYSCCNLLDLSAVKIFVHWGLLWNAIYAIIMIWRLMYWWWVYIKRLHLPSSTSIHTKKNLCLNECKSILKRLTCHKNVFTPK